MKSQHLRSTKINICVICLFTVSLLGDEPGIIVSDFQVNDFMETQFSRLNPVTAVAENGSYVTAWQDNRSGQKNIYAQRFSSDGTALGDNFLVNDDTKKNNRPHFPPAIAVDTSGDFVIVWPDSRVSVTAPYRLYFQIYDKDGNLLGTNNSVDENRLSGFTQSSPAVAYSDSGKIIVVWEESLSGGFKDIAMRKLDNQGNYLGEIVMVNDNSIDLTRQHAAIACNSSGNYVIAWQDYSIDFNWGDIHYKRFDSSDSQVGSEHRANDDPKGVPSAQRDAAIALNDSGDFIISWKDARNGNYDIFAQRYDAEGQTLGDNFRVDNDPDSLDQQNPAVAIKTDGGCLITWSDNRNGGEIYGQRYDKEGAPISENFIINDDTTGTQTYPDIGIDEKDDFIITWQDNLNWDTHTDVYIQKVLSDGIMDGSNFKISDNVWNGKQWSSNIVSFDDGRRIVVWQNEQANYGDIYAQIYDNGANPVGENFKVNGDNQAGFKDVAAGIDKKALVVWTHYQKLNNEYYFYIQGQMISSDGTVSGSLFTIDTLDAGSAFVSVDYNNGTYVVAWHESQPPDYGNIFARRFDDNGDPLGPSFKVNDDIGSTVQNKPDIAINNQGDFLVAWQDLRDNKVDIFAQIYNSDGAMLDSNFRINPGQTDSAYFSPRLASIDNERFAVAYSPSQIYSDISLCFLGSDGSFIGTPIRINNEPGSRYLANPAIAAGDSSRIVVLWEDEDENYNYTIRGQRLIFNSKVDSNFSIENDTGSDQNNSAVNLWGKEIFIAWEDSRNEIIASDIWAKVLDFGNQDVTSISKISQQPRVFSLSQNYPNPFNPVTTINYQLPARSAGGPITNYIDLSIYNLLGQKVVTLVSKHQQAGTYQVEWDASGFASGVYIYRLQAEGKILNKKMLLLK